MESKRQRIICQPDDVKQALAERGSINSQHSISFVAECKSKIVQCETRNIENYLLCR